jgi:hypothetical protein
MCEIASCGHRFQSVRIQECETSHLESRPQNSPRDYHSGKLHWVHQCAERGRTDKEDNRKGAKHPDDGDDQGADSVLTLPNLRLTPTSASGRHLID